MLEIIIVLLAFVWAFIFVIRRYFDLRLTGDLFLLIGTIILLVGLTIGLICEHFRYSSCATQIEDIIVIPAYVLAAIGFYFYPLNRALNDIATGMSPLPVQHHRRSLTRKIGMLIGFMGTMAGIVKCYKSYPAISYLGITLIIVGSLLFLAAIVGFKRDRGNRG